MPAQRNDIRESVWFSSSVVVVGVEGSTDDGEGSTVATLTSLVGVALRVADGCSMLLLSARGDCRAITLAFFCIKRGVLP